jgi:hypothetical protein
MADTEYLARELAALRLAIGEVTTREYLRHELESLRTRLADLRAESPDREPAPAGDGVDRLQRIPSENQVRHCATPVTRVMYGDQVHEVKKQSRNMVSRRLT